MKNTALALVVSSLMAMGAAHAAAKDQGHGEIKFKGSIIDAPCSITADSANQTIDLGEVSNVALKSGGTNDGQSIHTPFTIKLEQCDTSGAGAKNVKITFTSATPSSFDPKLIGFDGSSTATGASIVVTDKAGKTLALDKSSSGQTLIDGTNNLDFYAFLQGGGASATITPGSFAAAANFVLEYA